VQINASNGAGRRGIILAVKAKALGVALVIALSAGRLLAAPHPALFIEDAILLEALPGGMRIQLADGSAAHMTQVHDGDWTVVYTDGRPSERWTRNATGWTISSSRGGLRRVRDSDLMAMRSGYTNLRGRRWIHTRNGYTSEGR